MNKNLIILILTISFAFVLRVFTIDSLPVGFTPDEASFGYDAYSLLKTGRDQWGKTLPLVLESFGDFKLPLYSYITVPSVAIFGLSKFAVRLPNAIIGTLAVFATYLLVLELFKNPKGKNNLIALSSALLLAVSPWHVMMSRGAFEANLTTFFLPMGVLYFLKGIKNSKYLLLSSLILGLNLFTYHSARLVTPLILFVLAIIYRKEILSGLLVRGGRQKDKAKIASVILFLVFVILAGVTLIQGGARRAQGITIFSGAVETASEERFIAVYSGISQTTARVFHNKFNTIAERFIYNYSQYFSPNFLFINGPAEGTYGMTPGFGVLYLFEILLLIGFVIYLFRGSERKASQIILWWLIIAPIPAALTQGQGFSANRSVIMLPALTIASAIGFIYFINLIKERYTKKLQLIFTSVFSAVFVFLFISFLEQYFVLSYHKNAKPMLWGNMEVAGWLKENTEGVDNIVVSKSLSEPHIYVAFANKWDPSEYQKNTADWERYKSDNLSFIDQLGSYALGKYTFTSIDYKSYQNKKATLLVGKPSEFPEGISPVTKFLYPDGSAAVIVVKPFSEAYAAKID